MAEDCSISRTHPERSHEGYHEFEEHDDPNCEPYGSFEVFYADRATRYQWDTLKSADPRAVQGDVPLQPGWVLVGLLSRLSARW